MKTNATSSDATGTSPRRQQDRAVATRRAVLDSVIECLDQLGYAETSFSAIQSRSGLSRGSVNYHFPTRYDMIVAAAELMLDNARAGAISYFGRAHGQDSAGDYGQIAQLLWSRVVNTSAGRAFVELMVAARTDPNLEFALNDMLAQWDADLNQQLRATYPDDPELMVTVWDLCRTYLRGLLIQARFAPDPMALQSKIDQFSKIVWQFVQSRKST